MTTKPMCDGCGIPLKVAAGAGGGSTYCSRCASPYTEPNVEARATPDRKTEPVFTAPRKPVSAPAPPDPAPVSSYTDLTPPPRNEPEHQATEPMVSLGCGSVWHLPVLVGVSIYAAVATALAVWGWIR